MLVAALGLVLLLGATPFRAGPTFSRAQLAEDLRVAHDALIEGHPGVDRFTSRADLDRAFQEAERGLGESGDAYALFRALAPAVAQVRCGHTGISLPESLQTDLTTNRRLLPMQMWIDRDRLFVYRDGSSPDERYQGREVLSIAGVPAREIVKRLVSSMPRDGFSDASAALRLRGWRFSGQLSRMYGWEGDFPMELRDAAGKHERVTIAGRQLPELQKWIAAKYPADVANPKRPAELEFLDDGRIARLKIFMFGGAMDDSGKVSLGDWMQTAFEDIAKHGSTSLVLDLRGNGGGRDALGRILLQHLVSQPFRYYDDLVINARTMSFGRYQAEPDTVPDDFVEARADGKLHAIQHPNWGEHPPATPVFGGRVFALVDGASFSTTCEFLSHVRDLGRATIIGQESGGAYVGNTSGFTSEVRLPNTGVVIGVPRMRYDLAVKPMKPFGRGILPDVPVNYDIQEKIAGKDKELAVALELARAGKGTP